MRMTIKYLFIVCFPFSPCLIILSASRNSLLTIIRYNLTQLVGLTRLTSQIGEPALLMNPKLILALVALVVLAAAGYFLYDAVLGETEAASGPINAPTLAVAATQAPAVTLEPEITEAPAASPTEAPAPTTEPASASSALQVFKINPAESQVSFTIYELLRGSPKDVLGVTDQVAGEVAVDPNDLSTAQVGEIVINARTLATDDDRRNSAIRNRILFTDQYEFITFKPTQITGLSGSGASGNTYTFQVTGDLTIKDVTQSVTFAVSLAAESAGRLSGVATAAILRSAFKLVVPDVPFVADVADEVKLEIQFVLAP